MKSNKNAIAVFIIWALFMLFCFGVAIYGILAESDILIKIFCIIELCLVVGTVVHRFTIAWILVQMEETDKNDDEIE